MEQDTQSLKPQWLLDPPRAAGAPNLSVAASSRSDCQGKDGSSRNHSSTRQDRYHSRQSSSRRNTGPNGSRRSDRDGMGKSKGYDNFGRNRDRDQEDFDSRDRESRSVAPDHNDFKSFNTCRSERDRMNRARLRADTWSKGVVSQTNCSAPNVDVSFSRSSNISQRNSVVSTRRNTAVATSTNNVTSGSNPVNVAFEREFPQLSLEDKNGKQGISKVSSSGISTPIQNVPLIVAPDGWKSVLAVLPESSDPKKSPVTSSVLQIVPSKQTEVPTNNGTALSMAETVMQAPLRVPVGHQQSIEAQKIEERTLRQYTLRPQTPPASKPSGLSSSKIKGTRIGDPTGPSKTAPRLKTQSANSSIRAPVKNDISKLSQSGSFQVLSREQNGNAHTTKDCPSKPVSTSTTPLVSMEPQKNPFVSQKFKIPTTPELPLQGSCGDRKSNARDKHIFFEMLRTKSSIGPTTEFVAGSQPSPSSSVDVKQDSSLNHGNDFSLLSGMKCTGREKCFCEEANSSEGSQRHLSDIEENISSFKPGIADGISQQLLVLNRETDLSSEPVDTGEEGFQQSLSDSAEASSSSAPADSDDGWNRSLSGHEEASSLSEVTEPEDEDYLTDLSPEDKRFLILLGWREDEIVQVEPLDFEEIADTIKGCEELKKKLQSMESNDNVKSILVHIYGQS